MYGLLAGVMVICMGPLWDLAAIKRLPCLKYSTIALMIILMSYSLYAVSFSAERFDLPAVATGVGWFLLVVSVPLMTYSIFIEIPLVNARAREGSGDGLITTGTYALTRHPGVLWYGLFLISLLLVARAKVLLVAAPIWFLLDVLWVVLQDRYLFILTFKEYPRYQKETPMLIPNRLSIKRCFNTLNNIGGVR